MVLFIDTLFQIILDRHQKQSPCMMLVPNKPKFHQNKVSNQYLNNFPEPYLQQDKEVATNREELRKTS